MIISYFTALSGLGDAFWKALRKLFPRAANILFLIPMTDKKPHVKLYALTTCGWCRKTKALLDSLGVEYTAVDVDVLSGDEREKVREEVRALNPAVSFPTMSIDAGKEVIIGFKADRIKEVLG